MTAAAVAVNDALPAPAGTTAGDGTVRPALLLATATEAAPLGAAALKVIVQVDVPAPVIAAGLQTSPLSCAGAGVRLTEAAADTPLAVAVIEATVVAATVPALAVNVVVLPPAATVTAAGVAKETLLSPIETVSPPVGAALFRVTVQVVAAPAGTVDGEQPRVEGTAGATSPSEALAVVPLRLAVTVAEPSAARLDAEAAKDAVDAPAATVTEAGILTAALSSESVTTAPPAGAAPANVTVQLADVPEPREVGAHTNEDNPAGAATGTVT
jgi:hypothetical protein